MSLYHKYICEKMKCYLSDSCLQIEKREKLILCDSSVSPCPLKHFLFFFNSTLDSFYFLRFLAHLAELCSPVRGDERFSLTFKVSPQRRTQTSVPACMSGPSSCELGVRRFIAICHPVGSNAAVCNPTAMTERSFLRHVT